MATLSEKVLEEGRTHLRNLDIDGFRGWHEKHLPYRNADHFMRSFHLFLRAGNVELALMLFNRTFPYVNPATDRVRVVAGGLAFVMSIVATAALVVALALLFLKAVAC